MSDNRTKTETSDEIQQATQAPDGLTVTTLSGGDVNVNPAEVTTIVELKRAVSKKTGEDRMIVFNNKSGSGEPLGDLELLANHPSAEWVVVVDEPFLIGQNCKFYGSADADAVDVEIVQKKDGLTVTVQVVLERPLSDYPVGDDEIHPKKVLRIDWKRIDKSYASFYPDENYCENSQLTNRVTIYVQSNGCIARILPISYPRFICIPGTLTNGSHKYDTTHKIGFDYNGYIGLDCDTIFPKTDGNGNLSWKVAIYDIEDTFEVIGDALLWRDIIEYYTTTVLHRRYGSYCGVPPSVRELKKQDRIERALQMADLPPTKPSVTPADFKRVRVALQLRHAILLDNITNNESNIEIVAEIQTGIERALAMMEQLFETVFERTEKVVSHLVTCVLQPSTVASLKRIQTQLTAEKSQITGQGYDIMKNGPVVVQRIIPLLQEIWKEMDELKTMEKLEHVLSTYMNWNKWKSWNVYEESALIKYDVSVLGHYVVRSISCFASQWALLNDAIKNTDVVEIVKKDLLSLTIGDIVIVKSYTHSPYDTHFEVARVGFQDPYCTKTLRLAILRNGKYTQTEIEMNDPAVMYHTIFRFKEKEGPPTKKPRLGEYGM